eukprot:PhF_6_TR22261/c0_g1_i1/m.31462/K04802/PCNA; proliferating cell nuclear antigen
MLDATFSKRHSVSFRDVMGSICDMFSECSLVANPNGFCIQGMDGSHVALVTYKVPAESLRDFQCDRNVEIGINTKSIAAVLKHVDKESPKVQLRYNSEENAGVIVISVDHNAMRSSEFILPLSASSPGVAGSPPMEHKAVVRIPSSYFSMACKDFLQFGDVLSIEVQGAPAPMVKFSGKGDVGSGALVFEASSGVFSVTTTVERTVKGEDDANRDDDDKDDVLLDGGGEEVVELPVVTLPPGEVAVAVLEPVSLNYALRYCTVFAKGARCSKEITVRLAKDAPAAYEYSIVDPDNADMSFGSLVFLLAPNAEDG